VVGDFVDHTLGAALIDVMLPFENFDVWRLDAEYEVLFDVSPVTGEKISQGIVGSGHAQTGRTIFHFEFVRYQLSDVVRLYLLFSEGIIRKDNVLIFLLEMN